MIIPSTLNALGVVFHIKSDSNENLEEEKMESGSEKFEKIYGEIRF
jgi:hypothetical protein